MFHGRESCFVEKPEELQGEIVFGVKIPNDDVEVVGGEVSLEGMDSGIDALLFFGGEQRNGVTEAGEDLRYWPQGSVDSFKRKLAVW